MALKKGNEVATIDVVLVTIKPIDAADELAFTTSNKVEVTPATETTDAIKNIVKGVLIAQKPASTIVTGNAITVTDNVFNPELVEILQGGTIEYWANAAHSSKSTTDAGYGIASYEPPVVGSNSKGKLFELCTYSAIYNAAGVITGYEKCIYPNCQGQPISMSSEDDVFRVPEYTVNSAPDRGEAPYHIDYLGPNDLPSFTSYSVTQTLSNVTSSFTGSSVSSGDRIVATLTADSGYEIDTVTVTMGGTDITSTAWNSLTSKVTIDAVTDNVVITATGTEQ